MSAIDIHVDLQDCARALQRAYGQLVDAYTMDAQSPDFEDNNGLGRSVATLGGFVRELAERVEVPLDGEARAQVKQKAPPKPPGRTAKAHEAMHPRTITITLLKEDLVRMFCAGSWPDEEDFPLSLIVGDNARQHAATILNILSTHESTDGDVPSDEANRINAAFHATEQAEAVSGLVRAIAIAERGAS